jgi:hypothetical protein
MKICSKCREKKSFDEFYKDNSQKCGFRSQCKKCVKEYLFSYRSKIENKQKANQRTKDWYEDPKNKALAKEYHKNYYQEPVNRKKALKRAANWRKDPKNKKNRNVLYQLRRKEDYIFDMICRLRSRLYVAFKDYSAKGKCKRADEYGIDYQAICEHLGPCPGKREDYHIDHIRPLCSFDFDELSQVREAFAPENHQWLTAEENLRKGDKYVKESNY